jgi:hypothetical protein
VFGARAVYTAPDGRTYEFDRDPTTPAFDDTDSGYRLSQVDATTFVVSHAGRRPHDYRGRRRGGARAAAHAPGRRDTASDVRHDERAAWPASTNARPAATRRSTCATTSAIG